MDVWPEETPDVIVDELTRAVVDFVLSWASVVVSSGAVTRDSAQGSPASARGEPPPGQRTPIVRR